MAPMDGMKRIAPTRLLDLPTALVVDIREYGARVPAPFVNVLRVPMSELADRLIELPDETLYIVCEWGLKSRRVVAYLTELGFDAVDVDGGLVALDGEDAAAGVSTA
jgi:rhodanese-related sulfurtransferase